MMPLTEPTKERLRLLFAPQDHAVVTELLESECGDNLPMVEPSDPLLAERIRFAVLKLSDGSIAVLKQATDGAKMDFRDTLDMAGFYSSDRAHLEWVPEENSSIHLSETSETRGENKSWRTNRP
jgi:hypothetical protein